MTRIATTLPSKQELERKKLQAELKEAEQRAERDKIQLLKSKVELEQAKLILDKKKREEREELAAAERSTTYYFNEAVAAGSVDDCIDMLGTWHRLDPDCDITIIFNSPGGLVTEGLALYDYIEELKETHKVTTVARGMAASMGGILLQAGHERVVGRNAHVLIHEVSKGAFGKLSEIEDALEWGKKLQTRLLEILAERSTMGVEEIKERWTKKDWWLDGAETVALGFADRVG